MQLAPIVADAETLPRGLLAVARRFEPASLEMLRSRALLRRTDTKFLLRSDVVIWALAAITNAYRVLPSGQRFLGRYRTIYFDTPDFLCFDDHRRGRRPRHKVRIRHYLDRQRTFFEIKSKLGNDVTTKHRELRTYGDESFSDADRRTVSRQTGLPAGELRPSLLIDFSRMTLLGIDSEERMTIDFNVGFDGGPDSNLEGVSIVEVKQAQLCRTTPIMKVLRAHGLRPHPASKYCTALALSRPSLRANALKRVLRTVERIQR